jgi:hypothetical protein
MGSVPQILQLRRRFSDVFPVDDVALERAGSIERAIDARVQAKAHVEHALQVNRRREGTRTFQLDRRTLFGEKEQYMNEVTRHSSLA